MYINVDVTNLISANDVSYRTGQIEKLKLFVQRSTNCAGDGDERRKGNCRSQWWKHSTVVGGGLQTPSDKSKVTIVIRIMNLLI